MFHLRNLRIRNTPAPPPSPGNPRQPGPSRTKSGPNRTPPPVFRFIRQPTLSHNAQPAAARRKETARPRLHGLCCFQKPPGPQARVLRRATRGSGPGVRLPHPPITDLRQRGNASNRSPRRPGQLFHRRPRDPVACDALHWASQQQIGNERQQNRDHRRLGWVNVLSSSHW
jgi:hypothetical protein